MRVIISFICEGFHKCKWVSLSVEYMNIWTTIHVTTYMNIWTYIHMRLWNNSHSFTAYICEKIHNESILHECPTHVSAFRKRFHCEKIHEKNRNIFFCEKFHECKIFHCDFFHKCKWFSLSYEHMNIWAYEQVFICEIFHKCKWVSLSIEYMNIWTVIHMWNYSQM
jgi:hypothetical protein